jgi:mRNA interferase RelE/StbE
MYRLLFSKQAVKTLRKLPRNVSRWIRQRLDQLAFDPYAPHLDVVRLQNRPGYRLRIGDWRVIYQLDDDQLIILIVKIGP